MAKSPAHRVGQIIGYALEQSVLPLLQEVANDHSLFLDTGGPRASRNGKKLLTWHDSDGNGHNLDFVLERGGSDAERGTPVAFIEVAWRRYTRHSVNKASEIANALIPLRQTHASTRPFTGAVVAGVWTDGGIQHMVSQGIRVLYVPIQEIVSAFATYGVDMDLGEGTSDAYQQEQIATWEGLPYGDRGDMAMSLMSESRERYVAFREQLDEHLRRQISRVLVLPLYGETLFFGTPSEAIAALRRDLNDSVRNESPLVRIEIQIRYSNGDQINAGFERASDAIAFLERQI